MPRFVYHYVAVNAPYHQLELILRMNLLRSERHDYTSFTFLRSGYAHREMRLKIDFVLLCKDYDVKPWIYIDPITQKSVHGEREVFIEGNLSNLRKYLVAIEVTNSLHERKLDTSPGPKFIRDNYKDVTYKTFTKFK